MLPWSVDSSNSIPSCCWVHKNFVCHAFQQIDLWRHFSMKTWSHCCWKRLDSTVGTNFYPMSNLLFLSKSVDKLVQSFMLTHLNKNDAKVASCLSVARITAQPAQVRLYNDIAVDIEFDFVTAACDKPIGDARRNGVRRTREHVRYHTWPHFSTNIVQNEW